MQEVFLKYDKKLHTNYIKSKKGEKFMINKRTGVFETNSSSVHSLVLANDGLEKCNMKIRRKKIDGEFKKLLVVRLAEFGKDYCIYNTQDEKLSYLVTLAFLVDGCQELDLLKDKYSYQKLEEKICKYCSCDGFWIDEETLDDAAIDHQTLTDYYSVSDFESIMGLEYVSFVFNKYAQLRTDCD